MILSMSRTCAGPGQGNRESRCLQGLYQISGRTSYRKIKGSLEIARLGVVMIVSLWNLTGISAALLQSDWKSINMDFAASRPHEILR